MVGGWSSHPSHFQGCGSKTSLSLKHFLEEIAGQGGQGRGLNSQHSEIKLFICKVVVLGCLTFTGQNDVCAEFNIRRLLKLEVSLCLP